MRKLFALTLLLSACSPVAAPAERRAIATFPSEWRTEAGWIGTFTDPDTNCQYLISRSTGAMTPRLGRDGIPVCGERWRFL